MGTRQTAGVFLGPGEVVATQSAHRASQQYPFGWGDLATVASAHVQASSTWRTTRTRLQEGSAPLQAKQPAGSFTVQARQLGSLPEQATKCWLTHSRRPHSPTASRAAHRVLPIHDIQDRDYRQDQGDCLEGLHGLIPFLSGTASCFVRACWPSTWFMAKRLRLATATFEDSLRTCHFGSRGRVFQAT